MIYTIGETVLDIIFKGFSPMAAKTGGSMVNTSVSLGRLGCPVHLITEIGNDETGRMMTKFLEENQVNIRHSYFFDEGNSAMALAFLNEKEDANYTFYKNYPNRRFQINFPEIKKNDLILFGSSFAISLDVRDKLYNLLSLARDAGAIIIYDPNFRKPHLKDLPGIKHFIRENIEFAHIVRGSDEDFRLIYNSGSVEETYQAIAHKENKVLIVTSGSEEVHLKSQHASLSVSVPSVNALSTIGAGDNFNAGIIYTLFQNQVKLEELSDLSVQEWKTILERGVAFGTHVCESYDNYISEEFASKMRSSCQD